MEVYYKAGQLVSNPDDESPPAYSGLAQEESLDQREVYSRGPDSRALSHFEPLHSDADMEEYRASSSSPHHYRNRYEPSNDDDKDDVDKGHVHVSRHEAGNTNRLLEDYLAENGVEAPKLSTLELQALELDRLESAERVRAANRVLAGVDGFEQWLADRGGLDSSVEGRAEERKQEITGGDDSRAEGGFSGGGLAHVGKRFRTVDHVKDGGEGERKEESVLAIHGKHKPLLSSQEHGRRSVPVQSGPRGLKKGSGAERDVHGDESRHYGHSSVDLSSSFHKRERRAAAARGLRSAVTDMTARLSAENSHVNRAPYPPPRAPTPTSRSLDLLSPALGSSLDLIDRNLRLLATGSGRRGGKEGSGVGGRPGEGNPIGSGHRVHTVPRVEEEGEGAEEGELEVRVARLEESLWQLRGRGGSREGEDEGGERGGRQEALDDSLEEEEGRGEVAVTAGDIQEGLQQVIERSRLVLEQMDRLERGGVGGGGESHGHGDEEWKSNEGAGGSMPVTRVLRDRSVSVSGRTDPVMGESELLRSVQVDVSKDGEVRLQLTRPVTSVAPITGGVRGWEGMVGGGGRKEDWIEGVDGRRHVSVSVDPRELEDVRGKQKGGESDVDVGELLKRLKRYEEEVTALKEQQHVLVQAVSTSRQQESREEYGPSSPLSQSLSQSLPSYTTDMPVVKRKHKRVKGSMDDEVEVEVEDEAERARREEAIASLAVQEAARVHSETLSLMQEEHRERVVELEREWEQRLQSSTATVLHSYRSSQLQRLSRVRDRILRRRLTSALATWRHMTGANRSETMKNSALKKSFKIVEKAAKRRIASGFAHWKRLCHRDRREVEKLKALKRLVSKIISVTSHAQDRAIRVWREVCLRAKVQSHGRDRDRAVLSRGLRVLTSAVNRLLIRAFRTWASGATSLHHHNRQQEEMATLHDQLCKMTERLHDVAMVGDEGSNPRAFLLAEQALNRELSAANLDLHKRLHELHVKLLELAGVPVGERAQLVRDVLYSREMELSKAKREIRALSDQIQRITAAGEGAAAIADDNVEYMAVRPEVMDVPGNLKGRHLGKAYGAASRRDGQLGVVDGVLSKRAAQQVILEELRRLQRVQEELEHSNRVGRSQLKAESSRASRLEVMTSILQQRLLEHQRTEAAMYALLEQRLGQAVVSELKIALSKMSPDVLGRTAAVSAERFITGTPERWLDDE
eukprot:gene1868-2198_t